MEMRRKDLAVTDPEAIDSIINSCDCFRLAFADGTHPYIVPLSLRIYPQRRRPQILLPQRCFREKGGPVQEAGHAGLWSWTTTGSFIPNE